MTAHMCLHGIKTSILPQLQLINHLQSMVTILTLSYSSFVESYDTHSIVPAVFSVPTMCYDHSYMCYTKFASQNCHMINLQNKLQDSFCFNESDQSLFIFISFTIFL